MVKPQFEVGKEPLGKGGVVREEGDRVDAVTQVLEAAAARGWGARALTTSPSRARRATWSSSPGCVGARCGRPRPGHGRGGPFRVLGGGG